jgi:hypothetical protein
VQVLKVLHRTTDARGLRDVLSHSPRVASRSGVNPARPHARGVPSGTARILRRDPRDRPDTEAEPDRNSSGVTPLPEQAVRLSYQALVYCWTPLSKYPFQKRGFRGTECFHGQE